MSHMFRGLSKYKLAYSHLWDTYGQSWLVRLSFTLAILSRICKLIALPVAISLIITHLSTRDFEAAQQAVLIYVGFSLALGVITTFVKYVGMLGENPVYDKASSHYFSRLINADLDYFNSHLAGYLTTATRQYCDSAIQLLRATRNTYINTVLSILFPLTVIIWLDPWLGLVALALSFVQAAYLLIASNSVDPYRKKARELYKRGSGHMADAISNILAIKSTAQEASYAKKIEHDAHAESTAFRARYTIEAKQIAIRELITVSFFMVLLWLTVQRMSGGHIDITAAVLVVTYTTTILTGIYALSDNLSEHDDFIDRLLPALELLKRQNQITDPAKPAKFNDVQGKIEFESVNFSYQDSSQQMVLKDFSLTIPAGQKLGVVGLSGAGKSTLTKLLLRFNDIDNGCILVDGFDIRDIRQTDLRSQIAYVPQEPLLFHTTIKENVLLGQPDASDEEIIKALKAAHAYSFIKELPEGINSIVGERGVKLSGGQKQRVAIARAVLRQAPIMVLDEATSALDSESEQIIKQSFAEILAGKTAIVVAHRLSTLSEMDRIVVIDKGKIVEDGSHNDLIVANGLYAKLWKRQLKLQED